MCSGANAAALAAFDVIDDEAVLGRVRERGALLAGQLGELVAAMRAGVTYVNVHTTQFPGGEIRGQLRAKHGGHGHGDDDRDDDED
mgnify:CR=1 FL=1